MRAPWCRSGLRRLWLAGPEGGGERAGWFGLLREDQFVSFGDGQPVLLVAMDDHHFALSLKEIRAGDPERDRGGRARRTEWPHRALRILGHGRVRSVRGTLAGVRRAKRSTHTTT